MSMLPILLVAIPVALVLAGLGVAAFIWSVRSGQMDDLDTPPWRAVDDDD